MKFPRFIGSHRVVALAALLLAGAILLPGDNAVSAAGPGVIERLGNGGEGGVAISADGRFVVITAQGIGNAVLVDRKAGSTQILPTPLFGAIDISDDGRFVVFATGEQLVPEDTCCADIYVYDREQDSYERVSVANDGSQADGDSDGWYDALSISGDGRFVAFSSQAANLAPGGSGSGLFVRDRLLGATGRVSDFYSGAVDISGDGRFVTFTAISVSVHDRDTDEDGIYDEPDAVETFLLGPGGWPTISDDGRFVAYYGNDGVVLHDRQSDTTAAVSVVWFGPAMELSGDGRYLAFATHLPLVPEDTNDFSDAYLYDRLTATSELLSVAMDGSPGNGGSAFGFPKESLGMIALTPDGRFAAFHSGATNFLPGEGAGVFLAGTSVLGLVDTDGDGCTDAQELGPLAALGGQRDPESFWDLFDVPVGEPAERDRRVNILDIGAIVTRFGAASETPPTKEEALAEALSPPPPAPAYHAASDRGGPIPGQELWNLLPPDGSINIIDVAAAVVQFGHTCRQPEDNPALDAATQATADLLNVPKESITLVGEKSEQWPDSCLGLPEPGEMCAMVFTSGFRITLAVGANTVIWRTNQDGTNVRLEALL